MLVSDILESLQFTLPLQVGKLLFRLACKHLVSPLVLTNVEEPQDLVEDQVQDKSAKHGNDTAVVLGGLCALEELRAGDLAHTVADEYPTGRHGSLCAASDVG